MPKPPKPEAKPYASFELAARTAISNRDNPETREDYTRAFDRWLAFLKERNESPSNPSAEVAIAFRDQLANHGWPPQNKAFSSETVRNYLAALSAIYRTVLAKQKPQAKWNPFNPKATKWPKPSKEGKTVPVRFEDVMKMLAVCDADEKPEGSRDGALLRLFYGTGLRRMSILTMKRECIFYHDDHAVTAQVLVKGSGKDTQKEVTLPAEAIEALERWLKIAPPSAFVFPAKDMGKNTKSKNSHMDLSTANRILKRRALEAGLANIRPHRFRAAFITSAFDAGLPWREIQASVHHEDPRSTKRYDKGLRGFNVADAVANFRNKNNENSEEDK